MDRINEMIELLDWYARYESDVTMRQSILFRDIQGVLEAIKEQGSITLQEVQDEH